MKKKQKEIIDAFLMEFSRKAYHDASITAVVKQLGIAKGSIYQYFNDKLDLFLYLLEHCNAIKIGYVGSADREEFADFRVYYRHIQEKGLEFDQNYPLESNFLHSMFRHMDVLSLKSITGTWKKQVIGWMENMIKAEVALGNFRKDIPIEAMAFMLFKVSSSMGEYMQFRYGVDIENQIQSIKPIYGHENENLLLKTVDEHLFLLKGAFNNSDNDTSK